MEKGLQQWKNTLKPEQVADGMNAAQANALRLLEDAEILLKSKRYPAAVSLAILSIEESGKIAVFREIAMARDGKELKEAWRSYRSHTKKNVGWGASDFVLKGARKLEDFLGMFAENAKHPEVLDNLKQVAFYTDCLGRANWSIPEDVIDEICANSIVEIARLKASDKKHTQREVELWIHHLKPVWKTNIEDMKRALIKWRKAMVSEGLLEESHVFDMFIGLETSYNKSIQPTAKASAD